jgi:hypothetical protein
MRNSPVMSPGPSGALMMRSTDREHLLARLVTAVWDSILGFPILRA